MSKSQRPRHPAPEPAQLCPLPSPDLQSTVGNAALQERMSLPDLEPQPGAFGSVAPMNEQPAALRDATGKRLSENEHIVPRGQLEALTTDPQTGIADYDDRHYRKDSTVRMERQTSLDKTHGNRGGPTADNVVTKQLRQGGPLNKGAIFESAIDNAKRARDATGSSVTDEAIHRGALGQDGHLFELQRMGETGQKIGAGADEVDEALKSFELVESVPQAEVGLGTRVLDKLGSAASVLGVLTGGWQMGRGVDQIVQGQAVEGAIDLAEGGVNVGMELGTAAATKAGVLAGEVGLAGGALTAGATLAASGSVMLAAETARAAAKGEPTPIDVADQFYGTHFGDIGGWIRGDY